MMDGITIERFKKFTSRDGRAIKDIAILDGLAYATDGRIAVASKLKTAFPNSVPTNFPLDGLLEYIDRLKTVQVWGDLYPEDVDNCLHIFGLKMKEEKYDRIREYNKRFKEVTCPCCRKVIYWDNEKEEVVQESEKFEFVDPRDLNVSTRIDFYNGYVLVNFCYIQMLLTNFGEQDMQFALGSDNKGNKLLFAASADRSILAVIMPLVEPYLNFVETEFRMMCAS